MRTLDIFLSAVGNRLFLLLLLLDREIEEGGQGERNKGVGFDISVPILCANQ